MKNKEKVLLSGNVALAEGAVRGGCRYYFGYPITPQNEVSAYLSKRLSEVSGRFVQSESEIAAINMVFGVAAGGGRAMTSSSSPGVSLKQEGLSYLSAAHLPCVVVNVMRGGPGLGNIAPSQGDYFQATRGGGHGDYRTIVLSPSSPQEMADFAYKGFELADKYRIPVLILADGIIGQMTEPVVLPGPLDLSSLPEKTWALAGARGGKRNVIKTLWLHPEDGVEQNNIMLMEKYSRIKNEVVMHELYEDVGEKGDVLIAAFGIVARICKKVVDSLNQKGIKASLFRPKTLWPFPESDLKRLSKKFKKVWVVEMNSGQMLEDVRLAVENSSKTAFYGRMGGGIPSEDEIEKNILKDFI